MAIETQDTMHLMKNINIRDISVKESRGKP